MGRLMGLISVGCLYLAGCAGPNATYNINSNIHYPPKDVVIVEKPVVQIVEKPLIVEKQVLVERDCHNHDYPGQGHRYGPGHISPPAHLHLQPRHNIPPQPPLPPQHQLPPRPILPQQLPPKDIIPNHAPGTPTLEGILRER